MPVALDPGEGDALWLMLIFALAVAVGGVAGIPFKEEELANAFIGINPTIGSRTITKFKREMSLPTGLSRRGVDDDAKTGISALAQADHSDICRHLHLLQCHT